MIKKKLKVIGVPWHTAHQYELAKLPWIKEYDLLINPYRSWADNYRPMPENVKMVNHYKRGYYDFAILHVDQQCIYNPEKEDRISKGRLYLEADKMIDDIPKIVINHMTPFHDKYESPFVVKWIRRIIGKNFMICNSYEAAKQWGFGKPVIHGFDSNDWWDLPKELRVVTTGSPRGMGKAYRRIFLTSVMRYLNEMDVPFVWLNVKPYPSMKNFDEYREFIGRSLVYFNWTWQSPRPRARTEAMLSGCCIVTTPYHTWRGEEDPESYFEGGKNGFLTSPQAEIKPGVIDNPFYTAELLKKLVLDKPEETLKVGQQGKGFAQKVFSQENYWKQWEEVLKEIEVL